jgi:ribonuclease P protein component
VAALAATQFTAMHTLSKEERLSGKVIIDLLFLKGSSFLVYPYRITYFWFKTEEIPHFPVRVMFTVPKKKFRRAVDRNLLKRQAKASYRTQKQNLYQNFANKQGFLALNFGYIAKEKVEYPKIEHQILLALQRLEQLKLSV